MPELQVSNSVSPTTVGGDLLLFGGQMTVFDGQVILVARLLLHVVIGTSQSVGAKWGCLLSHCPIPGSSVRHFCMNLLLHTGTKRLPCGGGLCMWMSLHVDVPSSEPIALCNASPPGRASSPRTLVQLCTREHEPENTPETGRKSQLKNLGIRPPKVGGASHRGGRPY